MFHGNWVLVYGDSTKTVGLAASQEVNSSVLAEGDKKIPQP